MGTIAPPGRDAAARNMPTSHLTSKKSLQKTAITGPTPSPSCPLSWLHRVHKSSAGITGIAPWEAHYKTDRNLTGTDRCPCQSTRQCDNAEIFTIENQRHAVYWQQQAYPVMLVIRTSDGTIRCTNIPEYLQKQGYKQVKQIVFKGERLLRRFCSGCTTACCRYQTRCAEAGQERAAYVIGAPRLSDWCKHGPYGTNVGLSGCTASRRPSALSRASKLFSSGLPRGESVR